MTDFTPTREQACAAELYNTGQNLRIEALAGTGKTTTLQYLVDQRRGPGRTLYTSFGNKVIADAKRRFPSSCRVATNHGLAWGVGRQYQERGRLVGRLSTHELAQSMGWSSARFAPHTDTTSGAFGVIETIARFCQSADADIHDGHATQSASRQLRYASSASAQGYAAMLAEAAREVWERMVDSNDALPVTHDVYLKRWALADPQLPYRSILLDEAQDANGVIVGVLQRQEHAQLVVVGDRRQAIYGWRGSVDAMDAFPIQHACALTQSWRFGPQIAAVANAVLARQCDSDLQVIGDPAQPGCVRPLSDPRCIIARTNASLVGELFITSRQSPGLRLGVVGGVDELIRLVDGAQRLRTDQRPRHPELDEFQHWEAVRAATEHEAYQHLRVLVDLVDSYGTIPLRQALDHARGNEKRPDLCHRLLSTAHKAKGSEYESVMLMNDFAVMGPPDKPELFGWTPEAGNLLYVAATRARKALDPTQCDAVCESWGPEAWPARSAA